MTTHGQRFALFTALYVPFFLALSGWGLDPVLTGVWFVNGPRIMWLFGLAGVALVAASVFHPAVKLVKISAAVGAVGALGRAVHQVAYDARWELRVLSAVLWCFLALAALRAGWVRVTGAPTGDPPSA